MKIYLALILTTLILGCKPKLNDVDLPKYNFDKTSGTYGEIITTYKVTILEDKVSKNQLISIASKFKEEDNSKFINIHFYSKNSDKNGIAQFSIIYGNDDLANGKDNNENNCEITDRTEINNASNISTFKIE
jgi:hypothetical protein